MIFPEIILNIVNGRVGKKEEKTVEIAGAEPVSNSKKGKVKETRRRLTYNERKEMDLLEKA